jgi:hypothetical protein
LALLIFNFAKAGQRLENIFLAGSLENSARLVGRDDVSLFMVGITLIAQRLGLGSKDVRSKKPRVRPSGKL